jgi:ankyrin repeat protein
MLAWMADQAGDWLRKPMETTPELTKADQIFMIACRAGLLDCVKVMMEKCEVRVDASFNGRQQEPLTDACRSGNAEVVRYLLERGASPNVGHPPVSFPLLEAAHKGNLPMVRALVEHGAAINGLNPMGQSALSFARRGGHAETIAYLLSVGALDPREIVAQRQVANGG